MADLKDVTPDDERDWLDWAAGRPQIIRDLAARFRPWKLYRMLSTGHRVVPYSFNEDGTMTVLVLGEYNLIAMERRVFGINPDDLVECALPSPGEMVGAKYAPGSDEELAFINAKRAELGNPPLTHDDIENMLADEEDEDPIDGKPS